MASHYCVKLNIILMRHYYYTEAKCCYLFIFPVALICPQRRIGLQLFLLTIVFAAIESIADS